MWQGPMGQPIEHVERGHGRLRLWHNAFSSASRVVPSGNIGGAPQGTFTGRWALESYLPTRSCTMCAAQMRPPCQWRYLARCAPRWEEETAHGVSRRTQEAGGSKRKGAVSPDSRVSPRTRGGSANCISCVRPPTPDVRILARPYNASSDCSASAGSPRVS